MTTATVDRPAVIEGNDDRRRRGIVLLVGAALLVLLIGTDALEFYWLPLITGLVYLAAAAVGGRGGALWATGFMVTGWGIAVLLVSEEVVGMQYGPAAFLLGLGIGGVLAAVAHQRGLISVSPLGVAATVALAGLFLAAEIRGLDNVVAGNVYPYAILLAIWGAWELRPGR